MKQDIKIVERIIPASSNSPVGKYSHITKITNPNHFYTFSGQVGVNKDGEFSDTYNEQVKQTFENIKSLLEDQLISVDNITKVNIWSVDEIDWDYFYSIWDDFFGSSYPSMTIAYILALGLPEIKLEIEIYAVD